MSKVGRPSILTKELWDKARSYLEVYSDLPHSIIPSVAGLSKFLQVARSTIYKWADENEEFSDMLDQILSEQEAKTLHNGLTGDFNATIAKLVLAKHGYSDSNKTELTGKDGDPISIIERSIVKAKNQDG